MVINHLHSSSDVRQCHVWHSMVTIVQDNKSRNIPEVALVRRWAVGVLGIWRGGVRWVKGGANGVSLRAT
jgi:hypothetical protein